MLFEIITSIDNAVLNSEVLSTLPKKNRRWFITWGLVFSVLVMRGVLPWLVTWLAIPSSGPLGPLGRSVYQDPETVMRLQASAQLLLVAAGTSLLLIFLYWLFVERHRNKRQMPFLIFGFIISGLLLIFANGYLGPTDAIRRATAIGTILFLVLLTTKLLAKIPKQHMSLSAGYRARMIYLEVLDSIFSIEGVLGAFAFTFSVPLIVIGNGIGAIIVRNVTAIHGPKIRAIGFIKTGAMYAMGFIGLIMICEGLGSQLPPWFPFLTTLVAMGLAFLQKNES